MFTFFFFFVFYTSGVAAQVQRFDSMCKQQTVNPFLEQLYNPQTQQYLNLYTGSEYIGTYPGTKGSAYFEWDTLQQGSIRYNGVCYPNIWLKYDLVQNAIVLTGKQNLAVALVPQKIDFFSIRNHLFVHLTPTNSALPAPEPGFYEVVYNRDSTSVLAKRKKTIERGPRVEDPYLFKQYNSYLIKIGSVFRAVNTEKDLLNAWPNRKEKLRQFIKENKLDFKRHKEQSIIKTVAYYPTL